MLPGPTLLLLAALALSATTAACSSSGGKRPLDAAVQDGVTIDYSFGDLPPGCPPGVGNDRHVGDVCTKGGGTPCAQGLICACDSFNGIIPPADTPCFCTIPILGRVCSDPSIPTGYCGQGATCCSYMTLGSICVPDACLQGQQCPVF